MKAIVRRMVQPGGRVEYDGRIYRGGVAVRSLVNHQVIVSPVNGTRAAVQVFSTRTFRAIGFAINRHVLRTRGGDELLRRLFEQGRRAVQVPS